VARIAAAVDVGSNSIHLLVAALDQGVLKPLADESVQLGLGDVVDRLGRLPPESRDSIVAALVSYAAISARLGAAEILELATEPLRRASNRSVIQADVLRATGRPLHVLSHEAEAQLTLLGVTGGGRLDGSLLVIDVGGGSTELIVARAGTDPVVGALPTGSARLTAALVHHDPPTWFEVNALRAEARRLVDRLPHSPAERGVGVGGSATNLARIAATQPGAGIGPVWVLDRARLERCLAVVTARPASQVSAAYAVSLRRAQQLAAGAALLEAVLVRSGLDLLQVSNASLREGAVIASAGGSDWQGRLHGLLT
jgi:exopolyphosphatase / guanosine-5'-triphosphate,3'-diphosphate pyrophosphatase